MSTFEFAGCCLALVIIIAAFRWAFKNETTKAVATNKQNNEPEPNVEELLGLSGVRGTKIRHKQSTIRSPSESPRAKRPTAAQDEITLADPLDSDSAFALPVMSTSEQFASPELVPSGPQSGRSSTIPDLNFLSTRPGITAPTTSSSPSPKDLPTIGQTAMLAPSIRPTPADERRMPLAREQKSLPVETMRQKVSLRWYGKGEKLSVENYVLTDPLIYSAPGSTQDDEASCIVPSLPIGRPVDELPGSLGYYPNYGRLSPIQRANYLQWLSQGRTQPLSDIGYAFLFFYGLERRLLLEKCDLSPIVKEVVRLLETYTFSGSFDSYLSRFLAFALARADIATLKDKWFEAVFERTRAQRDEQHLAVGLAWIHTRTLPLPVSWAMRIARLDPRSPRSIVLDRLPEQFRALFAKRYQERFGEGILLKASKRDTEITYRPASPSLLDHSLATTCLQPIRVPNVMGIQSQFAPLVDLWTHCIEELKPLSRVMAKGAEVLTRDAFEALPDDLKPGVEHPDKAHWDRIASDNAREDGVVVIEVGELATVHGIEKRPKLTAKQSDGIARTAHHVGFMIEPDTRILNRPYLWDEPVALLRAEEAPELPKDSRYAGASLMLELGIFVAAADGEVEDIEVDHIARFLESQFLLDPIDTRRLEARKQVLLSRPPSIAGIAKRLQAVLNEDQRQGVGQFLVGVAAANGSIDKKEITALRNAYKALDIPVIRLNQLLDDIRQVTTSLAGERQSDAHASEPGQVAMEPVEVYRPGAAPAPGEAIPPRPSPVDGFTLNEDLLRTILADTQRVVALIGQAMGEAEPDYLKPAESLLPSPPPDHARFEGLGARFQPALTELLTRSSWPMGAFNDLVRRHKLMSAETLDVINEWAIERFDDLVLEEEGKSLTVHTRLLLERQ